MPPLNRLRIPFFTGWSLLGGVLTLGLLLGCSSFSSEEKPLPDSTFTQVLSELHLASVRQSQNVSSPSGLRDSIFAHYGVRPSEFDATLRYYSRHPKAFQALYQSIVDTLQVRQNPSRNRASPKGVPDSLAEEKRREESTP